MSLEERTKAFDPLFKGISFEELKRLRLVCRQFNEVIRNCPQYVCGQVKFTNGWKKEMKQLTLKEVTKWENVYFDSFPMTLSKFARNYWSDGRLKVKILTLHRVHCECTILADCIRYCVLVESVTIDDIKFNETRAFVGENGQQREIKTVCPHLMYDSTSGGPISRSIKSIAIANQNIIPICILDLFQRKCQGLLHEFKINGQNMPDDERSLCLPSQEIVRRKIQNIMKDNVNTLVSFSLGDCTGNDGSLFVADLPNSIQNLQLEKVTFSLPRQNPRETVFYLNCIQNLHTNVLLREGDGNRFRKINELNLFFDGNFSSSQNLWFVVDKLKRELKVLGITFRANILGQDFNLANTLESATLLQTLVVKKSKNTHADGKNFDTEFLKNLPPSLKQLTVDLNPTPSTAIFSTIIEKCRGMTQLIIGNGGKNFTNENMHAIIKSMPLLQDLQVISASKLSDNGICSIPSVLAENIISNKSYSLLATPELLYQKVSRENFAILSELKHLRNISFRDCNITDISIRLAFHFAGIRSVDLSCNLNVTDIGLVWLCKQNPSLEKLTVKENLKVSHFGINQLVHTFPTLSKIYTTHAVCDRRYSELIGFEWPRFNQDVHVSRT